MDFTMARLPPSVVNASAGSPVTVNPDSRVQLQHEHHFRAVPDEAEDGVLALWHGMRNKASHHMMGGAGSDDEDDEDGEEGEDKDAMQRLLLPMEAMPLLMALMPGKAGYPKMAVADLPMEPESALAVCAELAELGLLVVV